jgi:hypothetical protein
VLDDRDRATLHEIQRQFLAEDPRFVQSFDARTQRLSSSPRRPVDEFRRAQTVLMWISAVLGVMLLLTGATAGALLLGVIAAALLIARPRGDAAPPLT